MQPRFSQEIGPQPGRDAKRIFGIPGLNVRDEGGWIALGFNFYPLSNRNSRGFVFNFGSWKFSCRWSRVQRRLCWGFYR
jgi:hypothetical protein